MADYLSLPNDLPAPEDDGAAEHLPGAPAPHVTLRSTTGQEATLDQLGPGRTVLYIYPLTCGFRDHYVELKAAGANTIYGLSSQSTGYQAELAERLGLPFGILSDPGLEVADALHLPTFTAGGQRLYKRLTLVIADGLVEHAFYPIFPPDRHAIEVLDWLRTHESAPV
jgi:peroxiredoxin